MAGTESTPAFLHALTTLDFGAVLEHVAARCVNDAARRAIRSLRPGSDGEVIAASHAEIDEYWRRRAQSGDVPIGDTSCRVDIEGELAREASIPPERLLTVASAERSAAEVKRALSSDDEFPLLATIAAVITPHPDLCNAIENAIETDGSIKDAASPALRAIRRDLHRLRVSLRALSEKLVGQYGAESLGTVLGSRYVLLAPRSKIRRDSGLVHSASHSGESLYFEPFQLVERNNDLESRTSDEKAEEARILEDLRSRVRAAADEILSSLDAADRLDAIRARARFSEEFRCTTPATSAGGRVRLIDARHPVLERLLRDAGNSPLVPLSLSLDPEQRLMVITGPNAGGKTVALKTVGVASLLFQCGLQVPCGEGSELPIFERIFVDIGDEQSLESSLSTFTSHLKHLDTMSRLADRDTLCLIDEIGDGTDPDEGAALAVATLEKLIQSGAAVIATTHYGRIKTFALSAEGVTNASMAFEDLEARPLYRLLQGVAGRSRGLETARRAGFDNVVIERAESYVGADAFRLESVLSQLESNLRALETQRGDVARREAELERLIDECHARSAEYDLTRREAMGRATQEAEALLRETRRESERIVQALRESKGESDVIRESRRKIEALMEHTREMREEARAAQAPRLETVRPGDRVSLSAAGVPAGVVAEVDGGEATVEFGNKRVRIRVESLYQAASESAGAAPAPGYDYRAEPLTSTSIDVRGSDREDAIADVTRFIDQAVYTGMREVKIIHGVGGGVLGRAVRELLRDDPRVSAMRQGEQVEGGIGVTIVELTG